MMISDAEIVDDIRLVAKKLESNQLSRSDYIQHGRFSYYQVYDGGRTWENLCTAAGITTKRKEPVPDEVYFQRLRQAVEELGRLPKVSERKKYKLNFSKRRFPTLNSFLQRASEFGVIDAFVHGSTESHLPTPLIDFSAPEVDLLTPQISKQRQVPPIPIRTRRKKWERTGVISFPYAPQDELGVVAIFAILCSQDKINWDILELSGGKGIDATCLIGL
jgi:hypothetical protein